MSPSVLEEISAMAGQERGESDVRPRKKRRWASKGTLKKRKDLGEMKERTSHSGGGHFHKGDREDPGMPQGLLGQKSRCFPCNLVIE